MIDFNIPPYSPNAINYINDAVKKKHICGDGKYTKMCSEWIEKRANVGKCLFTTSCTHALEMTALLCDIQSGDEVIMPSYTFASTADAFVMRGAKIKFIDINPKTMNIDENQIEDAITPKTKMIVVVHYAGVSCEMDVIMEIAERHGLFVVEDAAQGILSSYKGKALGTIGHFGCYSFHETKNYSMGEGGAILFDDLEEYLEKAEIIREKGTNRSKFYRGEVDKYSWVGVGSSYLPSELNMAYLWAQLEIADEINNKRLSVWNFYRESLGELSDHGLIELPYVPDYCEHNAHMFYIKVKDENERIQLLEFLKTGGVHATFHYVPLHQAPSGKINGEFVGQDIYTTKESLRIVRLPLNQWITNNEAEIVVDRIVSFYKNRGSCHNG